MSTVCVIPVWFSFQLYNDKHHYLQNLAKTRADFFVTHAILSPISTKQFGSV